MNLHTVHLKVLGVFGELSREAVSVNFMSDAVWNAAKNRSELLPADIEDAPPFIQWGGTSKEPKRLNGITNLQRFPLSDSDSDGEGMDDDPLRPRHVIGPTYRLVENDAQNAASAWTQTFGDPGFLETLTTNPFGNGKQALLHRDGRANEGWAYKSEWSIDENGCWFVTLYRFERHKNQNPDVDTLVLVWQSYEAGHWWRLEMSGSSARLIHTHTDDGTEIDFEKSVSLSIEKSTLDNAPITISFMPESRGVIRIQVEGAKDPTLIEIPNTLELRKFGNIIWPSTELYIQADGGACMWQTGNHEFTTEHQLRGGKMFLDFNPVSEGLDIQLLADIPSGTTVTAACYPLPLPDPLAGELPGGLFNEETLTPYEVVINGTTNGTKPFWIYGLTSHLTAGERTGSDAVAFTTESFLDGAGNSPIIEATPSLEPGGRGDSWQVTIRHVPGLPAMGAFKEHLCEIWVDGVRRLWNGVIVSETRTDMIDAETMNVFSAVQLSIDGPWSLNDEDLMKDDPVGDGQKPGLHIHTVLRNRGWKASEISGVPTTAGGRLLPSAAGGEPPATRPAKNVRRGDYLWDTTEKWGMGLRLMVDHVNGTFVLARRSTTPVAVFTSDETPGTRRMVAPLDVTEELPGVCNLFEVEGYKSIATKRRVGRVWRIWESVRKVTYRGYTGRWIRYQPVKDDACRTDDDCLWCLRSIVREHGRPGRILKFGADTYYPDVQPDRIFTIDGVPYEIQRVMEPEIADSKMDVLAKEWIEVG